MSQGRFSLYIKIKLPDGGISSGTIKFSSYSTAADYVDDLRYSDNTVLEVKLWDTQAKLVWSLKP